MGFVSSDTRLRELERAGTAGDLKAYGRYLQELVRQGRLGRERLELLAYLLWPPAWKALGWEESGYSQRELPLQAIQASRPGPVLRRCHAPSPVVEGALSLGEGHVVARRSGRGPLSLPRLGRHIARREEAVMAAIRAELVPWILGGDPVVERLRNDRS